MTRFRSKDQNADFSGLVVRGLDPGSRVLLLRASMTSDRDTIFALSSGRPPAAIAVVRISGPHAGVALEKMIGRLPEPRRAALAPSGVKRELSGRVVTDRANGRFIHGFASGSRTRKMLPFPLWLSSPTLPPNACERCFTMERPSPVPPSSRERALSTR